MADWHVGQKVVCVDSSVKPGLWWIAERFTALPVEGKIYVVRKVDVEPYSGVLGLWLEGISCKPNSDGWEPGFTATRFRPVVDFKNDISVFQEILDRVNKTIVVMA